MTQPTPHARVHDNRSTSTDVEDIDEGMIRDSVRAGLQSCLVYLIELQLQAKQAPWNLVDRDFRSLHIQLDEIVGLARTGGDDVAERIHALDGLPNGRSEKVSLAHSLAGGPDGPLRADVVLDVVADRLRATIATLRNAHCRQA